ncbi:MAG: hypothetical protein WDZ35_00625 [Crocinitomicaceae bacterium]
MKKDKRFTLRIRHIPKRTFLWMCLFLAPALYGQPPAGSPPTSPPAGVVGEPCWNEECIPVDGGIIFLLVGSVLLGVRFIYAARRKKA